MIAGRRRVEEPPGEMEWSPLDHRIDLNALYPSELTQHHPAGKNARMNGTSA